MKKLLAFTFVLLAGISVSLAQKVAYIDSEYIMDQIPEYQAAQDEIERISQKWQQDLEQKYQAIEQMYTDYQAQEVLLPEDVRQQKQEAIFQAEREAKEYREQKFGFSGELFTLQESKVKPIQDKVFRAVEKVSQQRRYDLVFDKAGEVTWVYTNATYDLSADVLSEMGYKVDNQ